MTENVIDFYLDFISPFSYLAHEKLPELARRYDYELKYHPVDIAALKMLAGNYGPTNREISPKINVMKADIERWAKRYQIALNFPAGSDFSIWNMGAQFAIEHGKGNEFVTKAFSCLWELGGDPSDKTILGDAAEFAGLNRAECIDYVSSSLGRTKLRKACVDANGKGVFGVPIMIAKNQIFWGNDRLDFLEEHIK